MARPIAESRLFDTEVAVIARPWGATRARREDPDHPANRAGLHQMLEHPGWVRPDGDREGLWFVPGWVIDAWLHPRIVALPILGPTYVHLLSPFSGALFTPGMTRHVRARARMGILDPSDERMVTVTIAGRGYAPALVRPGLVLDIELRRRDRVGARDVQDVDQTAALRAGYLGCVIDRVPLDDGRVLPGEPLEDICDGSLSLYRLLIEARVRASSMRE